MQPPAKYLDRDVPKIFTSLQQDKTLQKNSFNCLIQMRLFLTTVSTLAHVFFTKQGYAQQKFCFRPNKQAIHLADPFGTKAFPKVGSEKVVARKNTHTVLEQLLQLVCTSITSGTIGMGLMCFVEPFNVWVYGFYTHSSFLGETIKLLYLDTKGR